jgi:hypothetical protein
MCTSQLCHFLLLSCKILKLNTGRRYRAGRNKELARLAYLDRQAREEREKVFSKKFPFSFLSPFSANTTYNCTGGVFGQTDGGDS